MDNGVKDTTVWGISIISLFAFGHPIAAILLIVLFYMEYNDEPKKPSGS